MSVLRSTLTFIKRKEPLIVASRMANLVGDDAKFLAQHISGIREGATLDGALLSRFHHGSGVTALLEDLLTADNARFVEISAGFAHRLHASMNQPSKSKSGVLAVIVSGEGDTAETVSVLKLDPIATEEELWARYALSQKGQVRLNALRDLLPGSSGLQKGISWPDPRSSSEAVVVDRNWEAALYFFNAFELEVSTTQGESQKALGEAIVNNVPPEQLPEVMQFVRTLDAGPAHEIAARVRERYPSVPVEAPALGGGGGLGGFVRPNKVPAVVRYQRDGITVTIPDDRLDRVIVSPVGGEWHMTIRFTTDPRT